MKIGVFDSGLGGKYVADRLSEIFQSDEILYVNDRSNLPYGDKTAKQIQTLTAAAIRPLLNAGCHAIVIACNSATTNAITYLRQQYPDIFFVGIEPMIKPAATLSQTKRIAVCATPATLNSSGYQQLKQLYGQNLEIIEPNCSDWARLIENGQTDKIDVESTAQDIVSQRCDVIVLGCTHYHYLKERFQLAAPGISILEPTDAIASRIANQLSKERSRTQ